LAQGELKDSVEFILLGIQGSAQPAKDFVKKNNISGMRTGFVHTDLKKEVVNGKYGLKFIPHNVLIGKDGLVIKNVRFDANDIRAAARE